MDDVAIARLPDHAARGTFKMRRHGGRDQVAVAVDSGGWKSFERPFPGYFYAWAKLYPGLIIDVGANSGFYTLLGACASLKNKLLSFEPNAEIMSVFHDNIRLSEVSSQVLAAPVALSDKPGRATLFIPTQEHGLIETSSSLEAGFKAAHSERRDVEVDTLDAYVRRSASKTPVSIIKIDVEGHEPAVLKGASATVASWRPIIFVEVVVSEGLDFFTSFLKEHGYSDIPLRPDSALTPGSEVEFVADGWNHALVPNEKLPLFLELDP